jgi:hypothetical protein
MSYEAILATVAAVCVAAWPSLKSAAVWLATPRPSAPTAVKPSYTKAMDDIQSVRQRLLRTECLHEEQKAAIDVLTLALVSGSDK